MSVATIPFGPTGLVVYERTYSRTKDDGTKETWRDTVRRVARGNLALVYGDDWEKWSPEVTLEFAKLCHYMDRFAILPAGRHLWATGATNHLFNCHVSGWGEKFSDHFEFSAMRLFEGGGVGANYSTKHIEKYGAPRQNVEVHIVCREDHPDYKELEPYLSYVSRDQADRTVSDSREGWAEVLTDIIDYAYEKQTTAYGVVVYDVSHVRPSGSPLVSSGGVASGPAPLARMLLEVAEILNRAHERGSITPLDAMEIDHAISEAVVAGGNRRSARMAIVHWNDPYIKDFLRCKADTGKHWTTNISVEIDDDFLAQLSLPGGAHSSVAKAVHARVVKGMLTNGEPGYWNSSLSKVGETGEIIATNPCGEIALEAWENCNLGHINLDYFAPKGNIHNPAHERFDYAGMKEAHRLITRFLVRATYGEVNDPKQAEMLARNRRIGVGHLGVQGFWAKLGVKYREIPSAAGAKTMLQTLHNLVRQTARDYAFQLRIPEPVKVTTVAPTGSIAKLPGVSEGIHPIYARHFERRIRFSLRDAAQANQVLEFAAQGFKTERDVYDQSGMTEVVVFPTEDILVGQVRELGWPEDVVESADEISVKDMLRVQRLYQQYWADNAVSYTVNVKPGTVTEDELAGLLAEYLPVLKGTTVMVDESRPQAPYTRISKAEYDSAIAKTVEDSTDENCANGSCPVR